MSEVSVTGEKHESGLIGGLRKLVERWMEEEYGGSFAYVTGPEAAHQRTKELSTLIDAHAATSGWLPIDSAPKDGTWIVVVGSLQGQWFRGRPRACVTRWWSEADQSDSPCCVAGWCYIAPGYCDLIEPFAWQPLPAPPTSDKPTEDSL